MDRAQILTVIFLAIGILYGFIIHKIFNLRKMSYYRQRLYDTPGIVLIVIIYGWFLFQGLSLKAFIYTTIFSILGMLLYMVMVKVSADSLGKISSFREWRKDIIFKRIAKNKARGLRPIDMQEKGTLPNNETLLDYGFSREELDNLGLTV